MDLEVSSDGVHGLGLASMSCGQWPEGGWALLLPSRTPKGSPSQKAYGCPAITWSATPTTPAQGGLSLLGPFIKELPAQ